MQRSTLHSTPELIRLRHQAKFDSMWRLDMLLSVAEGHRLDAQRAEVEEGLAERQQRQQSWSQPLPNHTITDLAEHRTQLRPGASGAAANYLGRNRAGKSAETHNTASLAPHQAVSRLAVRSTDPGRLTAFLGLLNAATQRGTASAASTGSSSFFSPSASLSFE